MLVAEREDEAVVRGRGLQFEVERPAETLAQGETPGAVDARAERRMNDKLHAAAFIEKSFGDNDVLAGNDAQGALTGVDVFDGLFGAALIERALAREHGDAV